MAMVIYIQLLTMVVHGYAAAEDFTRANTTSALLAFHLLPARRHELHDG